MKGVTGEGTAWVLANLILLRPGKGNVVLRPTTLALGHCWSQAWHGIKAAADVPCDIGPEESHLQHGSTSQLLQVAMTSTA
jgi:hypothetical protein